MMAVKADSLDNSVSSRQRANQGPGSEDNVERGDRLARNRL